MSPLNRVRISAVFVATLVAGGVVIWIKLHFGVPFSKYHWIPFAFLWFPICAGMLLGGIAHESMRSMGGRGTGSDVFRYIERKE